MLYRNPEEQAPMCSWMSGNEPKRVRFCGTCVRQVGQAMIAWPGRTSLYGLKAMPTAFVKKFGKTR